MEKTMNDIIVLDIKATIDWNVQRLYYYLNINHIISANRTPLLGIRSGIWNNTKTTCQLVRLKFN